MHPPSFPLSDRRHVLEWLVDAGVTEWIQDTPLTVLPSAAAAASAAVLVDTPAVENAPVVPQTTAGGVQSVTMNANVLAELAGLPDLAALANWLGAFRELSLCRTATQAVCGQGLRPDAPVDRPLLMVVAEAPDATEDQNGQIFSGAAHDVLRQALHALPLACPPFSADRIYLTYLSKWRPPGQRSLSLPELELAQAILSREIELVQPHHVIMLGDAVPRALGRIASKLIVQPNDAISAGDSLKNDRVPAGNRPTRAAVEKIYNIDFKLKNFEKTGEGRALSLQKPETMLKDALTKKRVWQNFLSFCLTLPAS